MSNSTAVSIANSYHDHRYGVVCNNHRTALYVFDRDHLFRKCIKKTIVMSGSISDSKLRSMISIFEGVQVASNFPPGTAKAIYDYFLPETGGVVYDMSCGYGGRLLAALASNKVHAYFGTDPCTDTYNGLNRMLSDLRRFTTKEVTILKQGSEIPTLFPMQHFDLCFTSPPYFNTEKYSREETQSFLAYPYHSDWLNKFLLPTIRNCMYLIKPDGLIVINIANVATFKSLERETVKTAEKAGCKLAETFYLRYSSMPGKGEKNRQHNTGKMRSEPIFVFRK